MMRPLLALAALAASACHPKPDPLPIPQGSPTPFVYEPPAHFAPVEWITSIPEARARAAEEHKPMIVFVRAAWSKGSVDMDTTVWGDTRVLAETPRFIALRVDVTESYAKEKKLPPALDAYAIESVPATVVVSSDGHVVGHFEAGTARAAEMAKALHEAK